MEFDIIYIVIVLGVILLSMTLHEAMHAFTSYWLGDDTAKQLGRLTLNPIKHIDPFLTILLPLMLAVIGGPIFGGAKPVPFMPDRVRGGDWGAALVALAGPLTNFLIAFLVFGAWVLVGLPPETELLGQILTTAIGVNLGFFVFNMLPIPPLDGSRVIYALAPEFVRTGMRAIEQYAGIFVVFIIVFFAGSALGVLMSTIIGAIVSLFRLVFGV